MPTPTPQPVTVRRVQPPPVAAAATPALSDLLFAVGMAAIPPALLALQRKQPGAALAMAGGLGITVYGMAKRDRGALTLGLTTAGAVAVIAFSGSVSQERPPRRPGGKSRR